MAKTILIIDDDPLIVHTLSRCLIARGFSIITAMDGDEGLEKAHREKPDLILLDIIMPKLNGYSVCSFLRSDPQTKHIPIIMITSCNRDEDREFDQDFAPDVFITKPFTARYVMEKIASLV